MRRIKFPFITLFLIGVLICSYILSQAITKSQRSSIAEEEMRISSILQEVFIKNFDPSLANEIDRGSKDFIEYSNNLYQEFIKSYLKSPADDGQKRLYMIQLRATEEALEEKNASFILNAFGARRHEGFVRTLISSATALLIHLNPLHLILTLFLFWVIGVNAEHVQGIWYFILLGVGGTLVNFFSASVSTGDISLFGFAPGLSILLGAYVYFNYDEEAYLFFPGVIKIYGIFILFLWIFYEAVLAIMIHTESYKTFTPFHIGGLVAGVAIAAVFKLSRTPIESSISKEALQPIEVAKRDMKLGNYRGAINQLGEILRRNPVDEEALRLMVKAYIASRGQQESISLVSYLIPDLVKRQKNKIAFDLYMDFSAAFPKAALSQEAQFLAGKLLFENNFFELAVNTLGVVTQMSLGSELCIEAVFEIGRIQLEKLNQPQQAVSMFNWIVQNFPTHRLAGPARNLIMRAQMPSS